MDNNDLILALGRLQGSIEESNKNTINKFQEIKEQLEEFKKKDEDLTKRIVCIEIDKKIVQKMASVVGFLTSIITTSVLTLAIKMVWR